MNFKLGDPKSFQPEKRLSFSGIRCYVPFEKGVQPQRIQESTPVYNEWENDHLT